MTNGLGASIGTILAGMVINHYCHWTDDGYLMGDWKTCWFIFAGYALVVAVAFAVLFPSEERTEIRKKKVILNARVKAEC